MNNYKIEVTTFENGGERFHIYEIEAPTTSEAVVSILSKYAFRNIENISVEDARVAVS